MADDDHDHDHGDELWAHCPEPHACESHGEIDSTMYVTALGLVFAAGFATVVGAAIVTVLPSRWANDPRFLVVGFGSAAGFMLMLIITELYPEGEASWCCVTTHHEGAATATFLAGLAAAAVLHEVTHRVVSGSHPPHDDKVLEAEGTEASALLADDGINMPRRRQATESALHVAIGLCLHNIPEGFLLFVNTLKGGNSGTLLIIAVTLHNIPIGAIVGSCVLAATGRRWKALLAAFGVGLAFPIAGLVAWAAGDSLASPTATAVSFALTAGILTFVCVRELLPAVFVRDSSPGKGTAVTSIFIGMALMAIIMVAMTEMGGHTH